jgi:hypothetical protein
MLRISRSSIEPGLQWPSFGESMLSLGFLRLGLRRSAPIESLPDHLRRDVGLPPRVEVTNPRDFRW